MRNLGEVVISEAEVRMPLSPVIRLATDRAGCCVVLFRLATPDTWFMSYEAEDGDMSELLDMAIITTTDELLLKYNINVNYYDEFMVVPISSESLKS